MSAPTIASPKIKRRAKALTTPMTSSPAASDSLDGHIGADAHTRTAVEGTNSATGRATRDTQFPPVGSGSTSDHGQFRRDDLHPAAVVGTDSLDGQRACDTQTRSAVEGTNSPSGARQDADSIGVSRHSGPILADPSLLMAAAIVDDLETTRNANANRLRQLTRDVEDSDGIERGFGLDDSHPDVARLAGIVDALDDLYADAVKGLERTMRKHPLGPWVKAQRGVGAKQAARLLAAIGDPYWNTLHDRPRTVSELWAYCGLHTLPGGHASLETQPPTAAGGTTSDHGHSARDTHATTAVVGTNVAAKRRKGVRANWSTDAKTRAYLIAESCMKQLDPGCKTDTGIGQHVDGCACSPYRIAVDERRTRTALTHPEWTPKHSLNDGLRIASKAILRDLWRAARDLHEEQT